MMLSADPSYAFFLAIPLVVAGLIGSFVWRSDRSEKLLRQWAQDGGYRLVEYEKAWFAKGPFFFRTSKYQVVYRVVVQRPDGQIVSGWVRCGGFLLGLHSNQTDVEWDIPKPEAPGFPVIFPGDENMRR